jgi:ubiquinone/menaquinone biosynthesis C-methylase UbiE
MDPTSEAATMAPEPQHPRITQLIQHHWNQRAASFDEDLAHGLHSDAQRLAWSNVLARLAGEPPRRVLEAGCGTAVLALLLAELGHRVTGVDLAAQMLDRAREKAKAQGLTVELRMEDVGALSDPEGTYDLVVARHVVWTLPDPAGTIREWRRVLRPGGRMAVIEGTWWTDQQTPGEAQTGGTTLARRAGRLLFALARPAQWSTVAGKVRARLQRLGEWWRARHSDDVQYADAHMRLPFYGGPSAEALTALLEREGLRDVVVEPLMDDVLWGETPKHPRYLVLGRR